MAESLSPGKRLPLVVHDLAAGGESVGRIENFVVFVPYGAPGDELEVEITELRKNFARGRITKVLSPSLRRIEPLCPIYYQCGGCQLQHIDYDSQLHFKTKTVKDSLRHLAGLDTVEVHPCLGLENPWYYRNKVQAVVAAKPFLKGGDRNEKPRFRHFIGLYAQGSHRVVKMEECLIQDKINNKVLQNAREILERLQWPVYDERDGSGLIRYLVVRSSLTTGDVLLVVVAAQPRLPQVQEFLNFMKRRVPRLLGVLLNLNPHQTNVVLGSRTQLLWGQDHLVEEVGDLKFHISPTSFFQVNTRGLQMLYRVLDDYADLKGRESVLDLYCGVGSLALHLARKARRVVGVDVSPAAVEDAVVNSDLNEVTNTIFHAGPVERLLPQMYREGMRFQVAIVDPPRKGCDIDTLKTMAKMRIPKLLYVSCNPSTLARDLGILADLGYRTHEIQPLDMFPQTHHVECVARLTEVGSHTGHAKGD
ncbi:MAG: 23S rRNA (uracil(1939)-C(5))-methyltransferase RlmD [Candidatus Eremiobacterota bacterium]